MTTKELTPKEIEILSQKNRSSSSVRLSETGLPSLREDDERLANTAMLAHAISVGDKPLYLDHRVRNKHRSISDALPLDKPFESQLSTIQTESITPTPELAYKRIVELAVAMMDKMTLDLYTPFMGAESQIKINEYVQGKLDTMTEFLLGVTPQGAEAGFEILSEPVEAEITDSVTRAFLYPSASVVNKENDLDSGDCDYHSNTSFRRGDRGHIMARSGSFVFFMSSYGTYGWIEEKHLANKLETTSETQKEYFYIGTHPIFFEVGNEKKVLLPGDTIYNWYEGFAVKERDKNGNEYLAYAPVPRLYATELLDFKNPADLKTAMLFLDELELPYMKAVFDCSEVLRRFFLLGGISLRKYSADMIQDLAAISPEVKTISDANQLESLPNGVFVMNLIDPAKPADRQSLHMFLVIKNGSEMRSFSYAFDILGDEAVDHPIGPHVCDARALTKQLGRERQLVTATIAA